MMAHKQLTKNNNNSSNTCILMQYYNKNIIKPSAIFVYTAIQSVVVSHEAANAAVVGTRKVQ
jgi:hypothetical protein